MPSEHTRQKVLIIGAGMGGLALAQICRSKNIPYEIFERDETPTSRRQGWAVGLAECLSRFQSLLPDDMENLETLSVNYGTDQGDYFCILNGKGDVMARMGGAKFGERGYVLRVSRSQMRQYLWKKLPIRTGKAFSHYVEDRDGVTAFFEDGSSARGSILVGADGANSRVRRQLLGEEHRPKLSEYVPILGEVRLPRHVYQPLRDLGSAGVLIATEESRLLISMHTTNGRDAPEADFYFVHATRSSDPAADSAWAQAASQQTLYKRVTESTAALPDFIKDVVRYTGPQGMVNPPIRFVEYVPPIALPRGRVTLLGDGAHTMVPFRGAGANSAITDACDLAEAVLEEEARASERGEVASVDWILRQYEDRMLPRGREMVLSSRAAGDGMSAVMGALKGRSALVNGKQVEIDDDDKALSRFTTDALARVAAGAKKMTDTAATPSMEMGATGSSEGEYEVLVTA